MIIFRSLKSGLYRSFKAWKGVLLIWLIFLILISAVAFPLRISANSAFGSSMITETLTDGFNLMTFTDLGPVLKTLRSFLSGGFVFICFAAFFINAFLTGGLFRCLKKDSGQTSSLDFFKASARYFWSFLIITLIVTLISFFISGFIFLVSSIFAGASVTISEKAIFIMVLTGSIIFLLILPVILLVADYSRAWSVANDSSSAFRAIGFAVRRTFKKFWGSYFLMAIVVLIQILFILLVLSVLPSWRPATGAGILILFLVSQIFYYLRLFLKAWRYASVTVIMEQNQDQELITKETV